MLGQVVGDLIPIWGGTELTTTRIIIAVVAEAILLFYFL
jgi:hypothetical protein